MNKSESQWQLVTRRGRKSTTSREVIDDPPLSPLDQYFRTQFPDAVYDSSKPEEEFERLVSLQNWKSSDEYAEARDKFKHAYVQQFGTSLAKFFAEFRGFDYNPDAEAKAEFERLRTFKRWFGTSYATYDQLKKTHIFRQYRTARHDFFDAFVEDFSCYFGKGDCVNDWVYLCDVLGVQNTPETIVGCKSALGNYFVNIYDLYCHVARKEQGSDLACYVDLRALGQYSMEKGLLYPLDRAKTTCMRFLLRKFIGIPGLRYDDWSRTLVPDDDQWD